MYPQLINTSRGHLNINAIACTEYKHETDKIAAELIVKFQGGPVQVFSGREAFELNEKLSNICITLPEPSYA